MSEQELRDALDFHANAVADAAGMLCKFVESDIPLHADAAANLHKHVGQSINLLRTVQDELLARVHASFAAKNKDYNALQASMHTTGRRRPW